MQNAIVTKLKQILNFVYDYFNLYDDHLPPHPHIIFT